MIRSLIAGIATFLVATPVLAAADVRVTIPAPAAVDVYTATHYAINVSNIGNAKANGVILTITLPATHTSPQVYVMGTLSAVDSRCVRTGTRLVCNLGTMVKNTSKIVTFDIELPQADEVLSITAAATSTSAENSLANNSATDTPTLRNFPIVVSDGDLAHVDHCTGTALTSFFECTLFPSSIAGFDMEFAAANALVFADWPANYGGSWTQTPVGSQMTDPEYLAFEITEDGLVVAEFEGFGASPACFEGVTTFPGSNYVAPYEVCL